MVLHIVKATSEAFAHIVDHQERENAKLKQRIYELEATLNPRPLFVEPLSIVHSVEESPGQAYKINKVTQLLFGVRSFIIEGIKTYSNLIVESFEILENVHRTGTHIQSFKNPLAFDL